MNNSSKNPVPIERQKILIVDDKEANLFALEKILEKTDADVIRADSGQEALVQVLDHDFALIILDVRMPGMDGYEVAEHLQGDQETRNIPIIFVTAEYPDEEHIFKGYNAGAIDYMLKPYSSRILLSKIRVLLEMDRNKKELLRHRDHLQKMVEERTSELAESNAILQAAMDNCQAGIAIADAPNGQIRYVNKAALEIRGETQEQAVKVDASKYVERWQILHLDGTPFKDDEPPLTRAVLYGETVSLEGIIRRSDNVDRIVWANAAPIKDSKGNITAGIVIFLDITERKESEKELQARNRELQRFNKAAVGRELRMIELKNEVNELCQKLGQEDAYPRHHIQEE